VTAVVAGAGLIIRLCRRQRQHLEHALWLVVLVKYLTPPLLISPTSVFSWANRDGAAAIPSVRLPVDAAIGLTPKLKSDPAAHHGNSRSGEVSPSPSFRDAGSAMTDMSPEVAAKPDAGLSSSANGAATKRSWRVSPLNPRGTPEVC
jgi:hypothetical protein